MVDYDLAEIYGYTTSAFNQQVSRNIEKLEGDEFMFQLTKRDIDELLVCKNNTSISQNVISRNNTIFKGQGGGVRKLITNERI